VVRDQPLARVKRIMVVVKIKISSDLQTAGFIVLGSLS
jgi:hypothetical protein